VIKNNVEINGFPRTFYYMNVSLSDIEEKLNKVQNDLNIKPEERIRVKFRDSAAGSKLVSLIVMIGLGYILYRSGTLKSIIYHEYVFILYSIIFVSLMNK
jgi:hypothetical protein